MLTKLIIFFFVVRLMELKENENKKRVPNLEGGEDDSWEIETLQQLGEEEEEEEEKKACVCFLELRVLVLIERQEIPNGMLRIVC